MSVRRSTILSTPMSRLSREAKTRGGLYLDWSKYYMCWQNIVKNGYDVFFEVLCLILFRGWHKKHVSTIFTEILPESY